MTAALLVLALVQAAASTLDTTTVDAMLENAVEGMAYEPEEAAPLHHVLEETTRWQIPINLATNEAMRGVPGISERDVRRILAHRASIGAITGYTDLLAAGLSRQTAASILPFVTFETGSRETPTRLRADVMQRWSRRLDVGRAYHDDSPSGYAGSPVAVQTRLRVRVGEHLSAGFTLDKDAGEPFLWSPRSNRFGVDYASAHFGLDGVGPIERLVAGGFSVQAGEGLVVGHGSSGLSALRVGSVDRLLRPHTSSREHAYFRGLAVQSRPVAGLSVAAFVSSSTIDARVDTLAGTWRPASPGPHRTTTERLGRRIARSHAAGLAAWLRRGSGQAGALASSTRQVLGPTSRLVESFSVFGGWIRRRWALSFEVVPQHGHRSVTASFTPADDAELSVRSRRTTARGLRPHTGVGARSSGESVSTSEWTVEYRFRPLGAWTTEVRFRMRRRPDGRLPSALNREAATVFEYGPSRWLLLHVRTSSSWSEEPAECRSDRLLLPCVARQDRRSLRIQLEYHHSSEMRSRTRLEGVRTSVDHADRPSYGVLLFQDVRWHPADFLQMDARYSVFDAVDPSARLYMLENDVRYSFNAPSLTGRGRRWYVLARLDAGARFSVQLRYGATVYEDVHTVGTGPDEVAGNRIREIKVQVSWRTP